MKYNIDSIFEKAINSDELISIRREFHINAEVSGNEFGTMHRIATYLENWGIEYEKGIANTGVVAIVRGSKYGKTVGVRGDIDALPVQEVNLNLSYRSINDGVMHACGHDVHTAILLGVAKLIKSIEYELCGNVKFFFQPNEENCGGAERMINEGCIENPYVDFILGTHVHPSFKCGTVGVKYGKMYATSDMIKLKIYGKASHGASPNEGIDAIVVSAQIISAIQTVVSRRTSPVNSAVCTFGTIKGGNVRNQIADYVELDGIIRTLDSRTRVITRELVRNICEGIASAMGARADLEVIESYKPLINTDFVTDIVKANAIEMLGPNNVIIEDEPQLGVEDFAYFAAERPSCFFHLGSNNENMDYPALHNSSFNVDEACLETGVKLQVKNILTLLETI